MINFFNRSVDFVRKNIGLILTLFFDLYAIYNLKLQLPSGSYKTLILFTGLCIISNIILLFMLKKIPKIKENFCKLFLLIAIPIGLLYIITIPIFAGTDEPLHFFRAYQISEGTISVDSDNYDTKIPENVLNLHYRKIKENYVPFRGFEKLENDNRVILPIDDAASQYSPIQYIPQILGIKIGEFLNLSPMMIVLLSRILIFSTWCILTYFSIKIFPYNKLLFLLVCLSPALLSLVSTTSGDIILNSFSFLFISYILKLFHDKPKLKFKNIILLLLLCVGISLCKTIYIILTLLLAIIPFECFESKNKKWFYVISIWIISFISDISWVTLSSLNLTSPESNSMEQLRYILSNPIDYIFIICRTFLGDFYYYITNFFSGSEMCYGKVNIPSILSISYVIIFLLSLEYNKNTEEFKNIKYLFWLIFLLIFGATVTALYINWTNIVGGIGYSTIEGVQSRYFIMLLPLILITFKVNTFFKIKQNILIKSCIYLNIFILLFSISSLIVVYR